MGLFKRWRRGGTAELAPDAPPRLLTYQVGNLQGQGTRSYQEDSFAFANAMDVTEIPTINALKEQQFRIRH